MNNKYKFIFVLLLIFASASCDNVSQDSPEPFADNNGKIPTMEEYDGPLFELSHDYPEEMPPSPVNPPWQQSIGVGQLTVENAEVYVQALKDFIEEDMRVLIFDYPNWDAGARGWYNQPWLGEIRESIHGTYEGSEFPADTFEESGLTVDITTHVLPYYDELSAFTVGDVWKGNGFAPDIEEGQAQFKEGAVIVKLALQTATPEQWPVIDGAELWPLFIDPDDTGTSTVTDTYLFQIDIIVKDSIASPDTTWVFSTLVYDKDVEGDVWDKMIPLGAMWGNDPDINSEIDDSPLQETWINPVAPEYSTATLGWGGRLSGPNDGAVASPANINGEIIENQPASACMSCHGPAEFELVSFLLPSPSDPEGTDIPTVDDDGNLVLFEPGSEDWNRWFQSRPGDVPQDEGSIPLDYDMVFAFKSLPAWEQATGLKDPDGRERPYIGLEKTSILTTLKRTYNGFFED